jgi:hypothetical protein
MSDAGDIRELLEAWPHDPDHDARIIRGKDGRELLQVRTPLGLEQLELSGRPDGIRPRGLATALEYYEREQARLEAGGGAGFELGAQECAELFSEGTIFYFRYLRLFQLSRWQDTVRDTARNLRLFDFVHRHAAREEDREYLEKWRPYVLRMNAAASALHWLEQGDASNALKVIEAGCERIAALAEINDDTFRFERDRSLAALRDLENEIGQKRPVPPVELLQHQLRRAIERQEFERAAELRDRIRALQSRPEAK